MRNMLQDSVERLFAQEVTPAILLSAEAGVWPAALWAGTEALGLPLAATPEAAGGVGAGWTDVFAIIKTCGFAAAPIPLPDVIFANWLMARAGIALPDQGLTVFAAGTAPEIIGQVPWGRHARRIVLFDATSQTLALHDAANALITPGQNVAGEPRDDIQLAQGSQIEMAASPFAVDIDPVRLGLALLRAGTAAGALDRLLQMSTAYANERIQFGRPVARFQAVQQQMAELATHAAAALSATEAAYRIADTGLDPHSIGVAKTVAGEASGKATAIAHAVHGAMGFTQEHSLHFFTRRLWAWRMEGGTDAWWAGELGRKAARLGSASVWQLLTETMSIQGVEA